MRKKLVLICLLFTISFVACTKKEKAPIEPEEDINANISLIKVGSITAGVSREESGEIIDAQTIFNTKDRSISFNVEVLNVLESTEVMAEWIIEDDGGPFTSYSLTATPDQTFAQFNLDKDTDWPVGTYTMRVTAGEDKKTFQFKVQ